MSFLIIFFFIPFAVLPPFCSRLFHHRQVSYSACKYQLLTTSGTSHYKALHDNTDRQVIIMATGPSLNS